MEDTEKIEEKIEDLNIEEKDKKGLLRKKVYIR